MAGATSALPEWLQYVWAISGSTALVVACAWTLGFFLPYLLRQERKMDESLKLGRETAEIISKVSDEIQPIIRDLKEVVHKVRVTAEQINGTLEPETIRKISTAIEKGVDTIPKLRDWIREQVPQVRIELEKHLYLMADDLLGRVIGPKSPDGERPL
jgi:uncharacterized protein YoxC